MTELSPRDLPFSQEGQRRQCALIPVIRVVTIFAQKLPLVQTSVDGSYAPQFQTYKRSLEALQTGHRNEALNNAVKWHSKEDIELVFRETGMPRTKEASRIRQQMLGLKFGGKHPVRQPRVQFLRSLRLIGVRRGRQG